MKAVRKVAAVFDGTIDSLAVVAAVLIILTMLAVSAEVAMRYLLHRPTLWVFEMTEYCMLAITFLGTAWVLKRGRHVSMDLVLSRLNPGNQVVVNVISSIAGALMCLVLTVYGVKVTWTYIHSGIVSSSPLMVPQGPIMAVIPVGSLLLFLQFLRRAYGYLGKWRVSRDKEQGL